MKGVAATAAGRAFLAFLRVATAVIACRAKTDAITPSFHLFALYDLMSDAREGFHGYLASARLRSWRTMNHEVERSCAMARRFSSSWSFFGIRKESATIALSLDFGVLDVVGIGLRLLGVLFNT